MPHKPTNQHKNHDGPEPTSEHTSFFRNIPTLYILIGREEAQFAAILDATHQKEMMKKQEQLESGKNIVFAVISVVRQILPH